MPSLTLLSVYYPPSCSLSACLLIAMICMAFVMLSLGIEAIGVGASFPGQIYQFLADRYRTETGTAFASLPMATQALIVNLLAGLPGQVGKLIPTLDSVGPTATLLAQNCFVVRAKF